MFLLKPVVLVLRIAATVAFVAVPALLLVALFPFLEGSGTYPLVNRVLAFDATLIDAVRSVVPTGMGRLDLARPFLVLAVLFVGVAIDFGATRLKALTSKPVLRKRVDQRKKHARRAKKQRRAVALESKAVPAKAAEPKSREELVRLMVEAKRKLDAMTKDVAFLAIDVVESTNMKVGEDSAFVEHDFKEFKKMVDGVTAKAGHLKSAWTPDGAMICFDSLDHAVRAAQGVLRQLPAFNAETRMMRTPFRVRCGINAGRVQYDATTPMEEMSDNIIDVAGHMQKYADPDTIYVATDLVRRRKLKRGFTPADSTVDGYTVSVWRGPSADALDSRPAVRPPEGDSAVLAVPAPALLQQGT